MSLLGWMAAGEHLENQREEIKNQLEAQGRIEEVAKKQEESEKGGGAAMILLSLFFGLPGLAILLSSKPGSSGDVVFMLGGIPAIIGLALLVGGIMKCLNAKQKAQTYVENAEARAREIKKKQIREEEEMRAQIRAELEEEAKKQKKK